MTYNKYTHFLMYEEGEEYDATYKAGTQAPFSGIYYCEVCGGSIISLAPSLCHHKSITRTRRHKARSDGGWRKIAL